MLCFMSLCRTHCLCFSYLFFVFVFVFVFSHPSSAWGVWSILSSPSSNYKKFNNDFKPSFTSSRSCTKLHLQSTFTFSSWSCHLKLTVFFLSKRQEFNLWKIGSPIIFLYRPAPFACSWCFPSVNKVNISNLLYRSNNGHRHIWLRKNKPTTIYNFLLMYTSGRQENMPFFVYLSFEGRPAIGWEIPPFCLCIRV